MAFSYSSEVTPKHLCAGRLELDIVWDQVPAASASPCLTRTGRENASTWTIATLASVLTVIRRITLAT